MSLSHSIFKRIPCYTALQVITEIGNPTYSMYRTKFMGVLKNVSKKPRVLQNVKIHKIVKLKYNNLICFHYHMQIIQVCVNDNKKLYLLKDY